MSTRLTLEDNEVNLMASLIRQEIRHHLRKQRAGVAKFGGSWDSTNADEKLASLADLYRRLGKDPSSITNLGERA